MRGGHYGSYGRGGYDPSRGRGGYMQRGGYHQGGRGGHQGDGQRIPPDGYICKRCQEKGHYVNDCPTNNDKDYDPNRQQGVPLTSKYQLEFLGPEEFMTKMDKTMKSLVKSVGIYSTDQNISKYPPSFLCQLCKNLLCEASITPCCQISCCFSCIKSKIVQTLTDEEMSTACPVCKKRNLTIAKVIPNNQMRDIIKWFERQRTYRAKTHTIELGKKEDSEEEDVDLSQQQLEKQIDLLVADFETKEKLDKEKAEQQKEMEVEQPVVPVPKFDKSLHAGTRYDPAKGIRVPVQSEDQLPKLKTNADQILELQKQKQVQMQQMYTLMKPPTINPEGDTISQRSKNSKRSRSRDRKRDHRRDDRERRDHRDRDRKKRSRTPPRKHDKYRR